MTKYLTVTQFAEALKFSREGVYNLIRKGRIKCDRIGGFRLIPASELDRVRLVQHGKRFWLVRKKS